MDFSTMQRKLIKADYSSTDDFVRDFELICNNAMAYNKRGHPLFKAAENLKAKGTKLIDFYLGRYPHVRSVKVGTARSEPGGQSDGVAPSLLSEEEWKDFLMEACADPNTMGYVHWTFSDQCVEDQYPSYLMARRLRPPKVATGIVVASKQDKKLPRGVCVRGLKYGAKFNSGPRSEYLGLFETTAEASEAYKQAKCKYVAMVRKWKKENGECEEPAVRVNDIDLADGSLFNAIDRWLVTDVKSPIPCRATQVMNSIGDLKGFEEFVCRAVPLRQDQTSVADKVKVKRKQKRLYNKVVRIVDKPPCYPHEFWFVYHYLHDMEWCHCVPLQQSGFFTGLKRYGRPRFKLVPEGECREIDVPASRCRPVRAVMVAHTNNADQEVWDIQDDELMTMGSHAQSSPRKPPRQRDAVGPSEHSAKSNPAAAPDTVLAENRAYQKRVGAAGLPLVKPIEPLPLDRARTHQYKPGHGQPANGESQHLEHNDFVVDDGEKLPLQRRCSDEDGTASPCPQPSPPTTARESVPSLRKRRGDSVGGRPGPPPRRSKRSVI
eukprot:scaffold699_cov385-Prasinococcus_capsulatus_cf.AAC.41